MLPAGAAEGQLPAGIAGEKEKTNQGGWFYSTLIGGQSIRVHKQTNTQIMGIKNPLLIINN